jgi:hypothetical protein
MVGAVELTGDIEVAVETTDHKSLMPTVFSLRV